MYDVWWWITKKIFLNDNFALFILSWLQKWNHLGVGVEFRVRFKNCLGVYTSSWPNFIFYVSFNSNLWFWFNFGVVFYFFGALKGCFWVPGMIHTVVGSTHVVEQLSFSMFPSTLAFNFDLMFWSFLTFWALMGYFWGWGRVQKLFCGLLM